MPDVLMYTTAICPYCVAAKNFLKSRGAGLDRGPGRRGRRAARRRCGADAAHLRCRRSSSATPTSAATTTWSRSTARGGLKPLLEATHERREAGERSRRASSPPSAQRMNERILGEDNQVIRRFFALDTQTYKRRRARREDQGAARAWSPRWCCAATTASAYHVAQCREAGVHARRVLRGLQRRRWWSAAASSSRTCGAAVDFLDQLEVRGRAALRRALRTTSLGCRLRCDRTGGPGACRSVRSRQRLTRATGFRTKLKRLVYCGRLPCKSMSSMRLSTIKLSGFKSFVDPTTLHLPTNMTGVVGPNGCGKSNIIDAVRWVMGESSASRLRGDSLTDVIFSGSVGAQAGQPGDGRADLRQLRRHHRRRVRALQRDLGQALGQPRRPVELLPQRRALPPPRHHRPVPRHRPGRAQLLDHRAGHDFPDHRGAPRGPARVPGGSRRHLQVQGAAQGNRDAHQAHAREPRAPERPARGSRQAARAPASARRAPPSSTRRSRPSARTRTRSSRRSSTASSTPSCTALRELLTQDETRSSQQIVAEQRARRGADRDLPRAAATRPSEKLSAVQAEGYRVGGELARIEQQIQHQRELRQRLETRARGSRRRLRADRRAHRRRRAPARRAAHGASPRPSRSSRRCNAEDDAAPGGAARRRGRAARLAAALGRLRDGAGRGRALGRSRAHQDRIPREAGARRTRAAAKRWRPRSATLDIDGARRSAGRRCRPSTTATRPGSTRWPSTLEATQGGAGARSRNSSASCRPSCRKRASRRRPRAAAWPRWKRCSTPRSGQEKNVALDWLQRAGPGRQRAPRRSRWTSTPAGKRAVETVLGSLLEAVLVDAPAGAAGATRQPRRRAASR